jgi:hypothetical protein
VATRDPEIGRHPVAGLEQHDVAGHEASAGTRVRRPSRRTRASGASMSLIAASACSALPLLNEADDRVDEHDREDDPGIDQMPSSRRHRRRAEQDVDQKVVELPQEAGDRPVVLRARFRQPVRPSPSR